MRQARRRSPSVGKLGRIRLKRSHSMPLVPRLILNSPFPEEFILGLIVHYSRSPFRNTQAITLRGMLAAMSRST